MESHGGSDELGLGTSEGEPKNWKPLYFQDLFFVRAWLGSVMGSATSWRPQPTGQSTPIPKNANAHAEIYVQCAYIVLPIRAERQPKVLFSNHFDGRASPEDESEGLSQDASVSQHVDEPSMSGSAADAQVATNWTSRHA